MNVSAFSQQFEHEVVDVVLTMQCQACLTYQAA